MPGKVAAGGRRPSALYHHAHTRQLLSDQLIRDQGLVIRDQSAGSSSLITDHGALSTEISDQLIRNQGLVIRDQSAGSSSLIPDHGSLSTEISDQLISDQEDPFFYPSAIRRFFYSLPSFE